MYRSEIAEIRRRFNPEKNGITCVRGCYVNEKKEIVACFERRESMRVKREEAAEAVRLIE